MPVPYRASARAGPNAPPRYPRRGGSCGANTVGNAFPTIQDALGCAVNGDSVSLAPTGSTPYPGFGTVGQNITISAQFGGIVNTSTGASAASLTLNASTVSGNEGTGTGPVSLTAENSTIAGNTGAGTGTGACSGLTSGVNGDQVSVPSGLLALANNGGPTNTAAPAPGSPAIGAGNATICEQAPIGNKDQRGHSRNATTRGGCDIGAYDTAGAS